MPSTPLFDPASFFRERPDPSLVLPTVVVLTDGLLLLAVAVAYAAWPGQYHASGMAAFADWESTWLAVGLIVAGRLVLWWLDAAVLYVLSAGGSGDYQGLLAYAGWGYLPFVLLTLVESVAFVALGGVGFPGAFSVVRTALGAVAVLWAVYVWTFAVRVGRGVPLWRSVVAASVPAILYGWQVLLV